MHILRLEPRRSSHTTIFRYLASEVAFSFSISFLFFFFIFFVNQILLMAEDILSKHAPFFQVVLLIIYSLPSVVAMAAPFAALVGTLMAIGRLSSDNEILVLRTSGLSQAVIYSPAIAVGIVISLISFLTNDILLPAGTLEFGRVYRKMLLSTPALELESNSIKRYRNTLIITGSVEDKAISNLVIMDRTNTGERRLIMANDAYLEENRNNTITLVTGTAFIHTASETARENYEYSISKGLRYSIQQKDLMQAVINPGPNEMTSRDVAREIKLKRINLERRKEARREALFANLLTLESAIREGNTGSQWNKRQGLRELAEANVKKLINADRDRDLRAYVLSYHKKFSIPFAAFCFIFLATPIALGTRKNGQAVGFGLGLMIAVLYWSLLIGGQTLGVRVGFSPFWAMWLPNMLILAIGWLWSLLRWLL